MNHGPLEKKSVLELVCGASPRWTDEGFRPYVAGGDHKRLFQRHFIQKLAQDFADQFGLLPWRIMSRLRDHLQLAASNVLPHQFAVSNG